MNDQNMVDACTLEVFDGTALDGFGLGWWLAEGKPNKNEQREIEVSYHGFPRESSDNVPKKYTRPFKYYPQSNNTNLFRVGNLVEVAKALQEDVSMDDLEGITLRNWEKPLPKVYSYPIRICGFVTKVRIISSFVTYNSKIVNQKYLEVDYFNPHHKKEFVHVSTVYKPDGWDLKFIKDVASRSPEHNHKNYIQQKIHEKEALKPPKGPMKNDHNQKDTFELLYIEACNSLL